MLIKTAWIPHNSSVARISRSAAGPSRILTGSGKMVPAAVVFDLQHAKIRRTSVSEIGTLESQSRTAETASEIDTIFAPSARLIISAQGDDLSSEHPARFRPILPW